MNNNNKSPQSNPFKMKIQTRCSATIIPICIHPGRFSKCKKKTKQNEKCITGLDTQRGKNTEFADDIKFQDSVFNKSIKITKRI